MKPKHSIWLALLVVLLVNCLSLTWVYPLASLYPSVTKFLPLVCRIERRSAGITSIPSYYGCLTLVNSLLSSLPIYWLSTIKFPKSVINKLMDFEKIVYRTGKVNVLWWTVAYRSKDEVDLSILNLRAQNKALLLKFADKFIILILWVKIT